jgi:hypothetical protein
MFLCVYLWKRIVSIFVILIALEESELLELDKKTSILRATNNLFRLNVSYYLFE